MINAYLLQASSKSRVGDGASCTITDRCWNKDSLAA